MAGVAELCAKEEDGSFPFSITLCRPCVVGEGQPFAELSYKRHTHQILQWPFHTFPFELSTGKLEIQVYLAEDELAFQQQFRKGCGSCALNLDSLQVGQGLNGLRELWLPLDVSPARSRLWPALPPSAMPRGMVVTQLRVLLQRREHLAATVWALSEVPKIFDVSVVSNEEDLVLSRWKAKYEKQRSVVEQLHKEHEETLQKMDDKMQRYKMQCAMVMEQSGQIVWQSLLHVTLRTWAGWVAEEKNQRQFDQLAEDARLFQGRSMAERKEKTQQLRQLEQEKDQEMRRERQLRLDGWMRLELWQVAFASLQDQLLCSWVLRRWQRCWRKGRQVERIALMLNRRGSDLLQQIVLSSWQSQLGDVALQRAAASFALRGDTAVHGRRLRQVTLRAAEGWLPKLEQRPLQLVLQKWILVVQSKRNNQVVANAMDFTAKRIYMATAGLLALCFCRWHSSIYRFDLRMEVGRARQHELWRKRRILTQRVMEVPCRVLPTCMVKFAFCCWQDVAQQTRVQKTLELQLSQREDAETQLSSGRKEMQRLQAVAVQEESAWDAEKVELQERLQHLQSRRNEAEVNVQNARERRATLEAQQAEQIQKVQDLRQQLG